MLGCQTKCVEHCGFVRDCLCVQHPLCVQDSLFVQDPLVSSGLLDSPRASVFINGNKHEFTLGDFEWFAIVF